MKKTALLTVSALLAAAPVFASDVEGSNVFGLLTVLSKATDTIVAVPWCECSTNDNQAIAISNIVKTANLTADDKLAALSTNGVYLNTWTLTRGADDVLYWQTDKMIVESGVTDTTIAADKTFAARGTAILLHRQNPTSDGDAVPFYLYGQVGTDATVSSTIYNTGAYPSTPVYSLIAPPTDADANLLASGVLTDPVDGDSIVVRNLQGIARTYTYNGSAWTYRARPDSAAETNALAINISAGTGAWYVSRNSSAKPTITWSGVPCK